MPLYVEEMPFYAEALERGWNVGSNAVEQRVSSMVEQRVSNAVEQRVSNEDSNKDSNKARRSRLSAYCKSGSPDSRPPKPRPYPTSTALTSIN